MTILTWLIRLARVPLVVGELYPIGLRVLWFKMRRACGYVVHPPDGSLELNLPEPDASGLPSADWLVQRLLETGVSELEWRGKWEGCQPLMVRMVGEAARHLAQQAVMDRARKLLGWQSILRRRLLLDLGSGFETCPPPYDVEEKVEEIRKLALHEKHFALCLEGRFQEARIVAGSGVRLEEIGDTLAVLGEFQAAREIAMHPDLEEFRRQGIKLVLVIELFRRGRTQEAIEQLAELEPSLTVGDRVHLALGIAGREPWGAYPYPDY